MESFKILQINNENDERYILSTTVEDVYFAFDEIFDALSKTLGKNFSVIVDMLLRNGFTFNRFIQLDFWETQVASHILNPREVPEVVKTTTKLYLKDHKELLEDCALSTRAKEFILT